MQNSPHNSGSGDKHSTEKSKEHGAKSGDSIVDSPPSVVGYAANMGQNGSFDFVGDFVFQVSF